MRTPLALAAVTLAAIATLGCNDSPRSQDQVRRETANATSTVASDIKGAALGIRDGLHKTADGKPSGEVRDDARTNAHTDRVNINTASRLTLMTLPGISASAAGQIVDHRPFHSTSELVKRHILTHDEFAEASPRITTSE